MRNLNITCFFYGLRIYAKAMVLSSDLTFTGDQVFYRMVHPPVSMMHFKGGYLIGQSQQLMTKTNSKCGFVFLQDVFYCLNRIRHRGRIARAVADKISGGTKFF